MRVDPRAISFGILVILFEILFFVLYITLVDYGEFGMPSWITYPNYTYTRPDNNTDNSTNTTLYYRNAFYFSDLSNEIEPYFFIPDNVTIPPVNGTLDGPYYTPVPITVMVYVGLGLLFSMYKCSGFTGLALVFFLAAFSFQWAALIVPWLMQAAVGVPSPEDIKFNITMIIEVMYAVFSIVVAYGALIGRASRVQLLIISVFGVVLYAVNRMVIVHYLLTLDMAGSMSVFTFGAFYGLSIAWAINVYHKSCRCTKTECCRMTGYFENLMSLLGTVILFSLWPYYCVYLIPVTLDMYLRAFVNTYFALVAGVVVTFAISTFVGICQKIDIIHVQRATLAAGVAISSVAATKTYIWGATLIGICAAFFSVLILRSIQLKFYKIYIVDAGAVFSTFAFPGILGGIAGAVMAALCLDLSYTEDELLLLYPAVAGNQGIGSIRSPATQGGYQFASLMVSIGMGIVGGLLVGLIIRWLGPLNDDEACNDNCTFLMPYGCSFPCDECKCPPQCQNTQIA